MRFDLRTALQVFAVMLFAGVLGLAIATLAVSRGPVPAEVTSSPMSPEHPLPRVSGVFDTSNFFTRAPDGEAHVGIRYEKPEAFRQLVHVYLSEVPESQRIAKVALQASDDGASWTKVGDAEVKGSNGAFDFDLTNSSAHKYWKVIVGKSGDGQDVAFGQLRFVDHGNYVRSVKLDRVWLGLIPALLLLMVSFQVSLTLGRLFAATAIPVLAFALAYSFGYVDYHIIVAPDSAGYLWRTLYGAYIPMRSAGYSTFLLLLSETVGLDRLAWVQLGAGLGCYLAGAYLLTIRFGNRWIGPLLVLAVLFQGTTTEFAPDVLTEALFTAALGLFAAALGVLAWRPDPLAVAAATVGIVIAVVSKSIGVVLVIPALLLIRFLPRGKRLSTSGAIVIAGLGTYGLLAASNFSRTGVFSPETFAGFALAGQVGWMLDDTSMPPSDLSRRMIDAVAPVVAQRPADLSVINSVAALDRYVDVTTGDYGAVLWEKLVPIAAKDLGPEVAINSFLLRLGIASIRARPMSYLRHVGAHFYGLWRDLKWTLSLRSATMFVREKPVYVIPQLAPDLIKATARFASLPSNDAVADAEVARQLVLPLRDRWSESLIVIVGPFTLGALAFVLSILFLIPGRLTYLYRTEVMIALSVNAYFGSHVLLQVSLHRYAAAATLAIMFLAMSFAFTTLYAIRDVLVAAVRIFSERARHDSLDRVSRALDLKTTG